MSGCAGEKPTSRCFKPPVVGWRRFKPRVSVPMSSALPCQCVLWVGCLGMAPRHRHADGTDTLPLSSPPPLFWRHCARCRFIRVPFSNPAPSPLQTVPAFFRCLL